MIPLLWALDKVHKDGIVHSDISPDNIMCNENGILKLLDFGSARQSIGERSHFAVLKMSYAPPELYDVEGHIGAWTDIYSICATLYMCITGVVPQPVVKRLLDDCIKKPSEMGISIKKSQENAIINGMELAYQKRFQSIHQLVSALSKPTDAAVVAEIDEEHTVDIETNDSFIKGEVDDLDATISCWNGLIQDENNSNVTVLEEGDCSSKASVTVLEDEDNYPLLIRLKTGEMYLCKTSLTTIGRTFEKCDLCFEDAKTMSGHHADLIVHKNKVYIKDNKSANGVFVNGDRISENGSTVLSNGAKLKLSKSEEFLFFSANNSNQVYCQKRLAAIHSIETDESMYLVSNEMQLGRSQPWSSGAMQNIKIGRKHAVLEVIGGKYYITDFSKNGTYKNEIRIQYGVRTQVFNGDVLRLGEEHFQFIILSLIDRSE